MMKGLIENECGGQNPLVKLATHHFANTSEQKITQDAIKTLRQQQHQQLNSDQMVNEYLQHEAGGSSASINMMPQQQQQQQHQQQIQQRRLAAPRSFQMESLFNELKQIDKSSQAYQSTQSINNPINLLSNSSNNSQTAASTIAAIHSLSTNNMNQLASDWSQEYWSSLSAAFQKQAPLIIDERSFKWSTDYLNQNMLFDEAWESLLMKNSLSTGSQDGLMMNANANGNLNNTSNNLLFELGKTSENAVATNQLNEEMRKTANELLDSMQDSRFSETEFLQFVRNLSVNALNSTDAKNKLTSKKQDDDKILEDLLKGDTTSAAAALSNTTLDDQDLVGEWVNEFQNFKLDANKLSETVKALGEKGEDEYDYWNELQNEWNTAASSNPNHPWLEEFQKVYDTYKTYEFDKENPLKAHPNPLEEGIERLKVHDIVNAVLLFEVAVQKEPTNMLAWQYLGTTQVKNEQDAQAIRALRKCLELKPDNLIALSTLATSYTNESIQRLAFESLVKWLQYHPDYSHLLKNDEQAVKLLANLDNQSQNENTMNTMGVVHIKDFIDLQEIFLKAVRQSASTPNKIDPDLQCCLGVLFHLSSEYDKAADCFKTALQIKPNDYLLWNKLGATYANNNRNEEAIDAYYQALKLCPGFVRARYNLGIGCMNLGAYKEAIEHFLTALVQQSQASLSTSVNESTSSKENVNITRANYTNIQQMSETIWSTLRLALSYLNRNDLYASCLNKDLDHLKQEFKI